MAVMKGWEGTHPEVGEYLQVNEYDAEISEVFEDQREAVVEIFYDDHSEFKTLDY